MEEPQWYGVPDKSVVTRQVRALMTESEIMGELLGGESVAGSKIKRQRVRLQEAETNLLASIDALYRKP